MDNPNAHYEGTGREILEQAKQVDMFVCGVGTGGTITGVSKKLKEAGPCIVVGVDPHGSILALPESLNAREGLYKVEGIGYDFVPKVLERNVVNEWIKTEDKESFLMARQLIKLEGLLCGGSSGTAVVAAIKAAKRLKKGQNCVVILPDSLRNYMSKFLDDKWMERNGFMEPKEETGTVKDLNLVNAVTCTSATTCRDAVKLMQEKGFDQLPVLQGKKLVGLVTLGNIFSKASSGFDQAVDSCMYHFGNGKVRRL